MSPRSPRYWLAKSEPSVFSWDDLWTSKGRRTSWDGIRNYQVRNFIRDDVRKGDLVLFYHSNAKPPGVAGIARVSRPGHPDPTQFDPNSDHHDPKSSPDAPRWFQVEVEFVERFPEVVSLDELKACPDLEGMLVTRRGQRLSVQPVEPEHFRVVRQLGRRRRGRG